MIVDDIAHRIMILRREHFMDDRNAKEPVFNIYMGTKLHANMISELRGEVSTFGYEMYHHNTLFGYPIYRVIDHDFWRVFKA